MTGDAIKQTKVVPIGDLCQIVSRMAGSRRGTADWHFATGHFGRKRAIRRRGGGGTPAAGTEPAGGTDEPAAKRRDGSRGGKFRPRARSRPAARMNRRRKGGAAAKRRGGGRRGKSRPVARQRRYSGRWHRGRPAARMNRRRKGGAAKGESSGRWHAGQRHKKGLRCRRPVSGGPDYIIYYRFCSPRIRIATSRIVVSSNVTTPPSGPGSK